MMMSIIYLDIFDKFTKINIKISKKRILHSLLIRNESDQFFCTDCSRKVKINLLT